MIRASRTTWWAVSDTAVRGARCTTHDSPSRSTRNISQLPPPRIAVTSRFTNTMRLCPSSTAMARAKSFAPKRSRPARRVAPASAGDPRAPPRCFEWSRAPRRFRRFARRAATARERVDCLPRAPRRLAMPHFESELALDDAGRSAIHLASPRLSRPGANIPDVLDGGVIDVNDPDYRTVDIFFYAYR